MSLTKFTGNTGVISGLPDEPTLSSAQLKGKFDEAGNAIKQYLNETLTVEIDQLVATEKQNLEGEISDLEDSMTEDISEAVENENKMISDNYSNLKTYKVGDLCIYNNALYRCISTISICESWNNEHWEQTTISENIESHIITGQEVATNQYVDGKRVFIKRVDCGYALNNTYKNISHGLSNVTFTKIEGIAYKDNSIITYPLPFAYADSDRIGIWTDENGIKVQTWGDKTDFHVFVDLYYIKNS